MSSEKPSGIKDNKGRELSLEQAKQVPVWRLPFPNSFQLEEGVVCLNHPKVEGYYGSLLSKSCRFASGWAYNHDSGTHYGKENVSAYAKQMIPIQTVFGTMMELPRWLVEEVIPSEYYNADGSLNIIQIKNRESFPDDGKILEGKHYVEVKKTSEGEYFIWLPDIDRTSGRLSERYDSNKGLSCMHFKKDGTLFSFRYNNHYYNFSEDHEKFIKEFAAEQQAKLEKEEQKENVSFDYCGNKFELNLSEAMKVLPIWRLADPTSYGIDFEKDEIYVEINARSKEGDFLESNILPEKSVFSKDTGSLLRTETHPSNKSKNLDEIITVKNKSGIEFSLPLWIYDEFLSFKQKQELDFSLWGRERWRLQENTETVLFEPLDEEEYSILLNPRSFFSDKSEPILSKIVVNQKTGQVLRAFYNGEYYTTEQSISKLYKILAGQPVNQNRKQDALQTISVTTSDGQSIELPKWFADALTEDEKQRLLSDPRMVQKRGGKPVLTYSSTNTIGLRKSDGFFYTNHIFDAVIDFNKDSPEKALEKLVDYRKYVENNHVDDYKKIQEALKKTGYSTLYASFAIVASKPSDMITYHFYQDGKSLKAVYYRDSKGNLHNKIGPAFIEYGLNGLVKLEEFWLNGTKFANEDEWNKAFVKSKQAKEEANKTENLEQEQSEKKDSSAKTIDNSLGGAAAAAGGLTMLAGVATLADKPSETTKSKGANTPVNMTMEKVKAIAISDSREVAKRIAVEKVSTIIRDLLINTMTANLKGKKKSQMMQTLASFFASEVGVATIQFMSGIGLPYIAPYLPEKYRGVVDEVSKELRIQGETKAAIEALGTIQPMIMMVVNGAMGSLSSLDAFVDETPVRVVTSAPATVHKEEEFAEVESAAVAAAKKA